MSAFHCEITTPCVVEADSVEEARIEAANWFKQALDEYLSPESSPEGWEPLFIWAEEMSD